MANASNWHRLALNGVILSVWWHLSSEFPSGRFLHALSTVQTELFTWLASPTPMPTDALEVFGVIATLIALLSARASFVSGRRGAQRSRRTTGCFEPAYRAALSRPGAARLHRAVDS
eukprot:5887498-Pyramimonas_sp.AAC.1